MQFGRSGNEFKMVQQCQQQQLREQEGTDFFTAVQGQKSRGKILTSLTFVSVNTKMKETIYYTRHKKLQQYLLSTFAASCKNPDQFLYFQWLSKFASYYIETFLKQIYNYRKMYSNYLCFIGKKIETQRLMGLSNPCQYLLKQ